VLAAREVLQNIVTHARATAVRVTLQLDDSALTIAISDDGAGFDPARVSGEGNGLPSMRKRLEEINGTLEIVSRPGAGSTVILKMPRNRLHGRVVGKKGFAS
jgi:signal transduction histidine kinase